MFRVHLNQEELDEMWWHYENGDSYDERQIAHIFLLYVDKSLSYSKIAEILYLDPNIVYLRLKSWYYFGKNGIFDEIEVLRSRILDLETPKNLEENTQSVEKNFLMELLLRAISFPFRILYQVIVKIIIYFISKIKALNFNKFYVSETHKVVGNEVRIEKNSNNNTIIQIISIGHEVTKQVALTSLAETKKMLSGILDGLDGDNILQSKNKIIALMMGTYTKIQELQDKGKREKLKGLLIGAVAMYIYYNIAVKSGVVTLTLFGIALVTVDFKTPEQKTENIQPIISPPQISNSISNNISKDSTIEDTLDFEEKLPDERDTYESDSACDWLTKIGAASELIIENDTIDPENEDFFISESDKRLYLLAVAYDDIYTAAYQRRFLVFRGYTNAKIIELDSKGSIRYGVSINDFSLDELDKLLSEKLEWDSYCTERKLDIHIGCE